ncbi:NACHT, LRR and PYD domains-containing protein 3-like isoform X3 [Salminus brasiliensis]|uniref:NACHT, LRR and PYD domains-containing protein 3-like isoform X3 n=1 Tax=Salminus brasiliensis TaxID=930266 RepID=UPI003B8358DF
MMEPQNFSSEEEISALKLQTFRAESPEPSCVSMKSNISMHQPHNFSNERSSTDLRLQTSRAEPPELSCVSMKSNISMHQPHNFSNARSSTDLRLQTCRAEPPELSCVSMKSNISMDQPHNFSNARSSTDLRLQTSRAEPPELSYVSMKSNNSMHQPHNFSNARSSTDPRLQTSRAESPELSCVSMKSNISMHQPHNFSNARSSTDLRLQTSRAEPPELSYVSMKSNNSMHQPHNFSNARSSTDLRLQTSRAEPPELSCVSMKSNNSMHQPHNFSNARSSTDLRLQTCRAEPPELSCVSMKSNNSMHQPHNFSNARSSTDPRLQTSRAESPELSCVSMKSNNSMHQPHNFSNARSSTDLRLQTSRAEPPELSCVSMKSNISMHQPHNFSNGWSSTDLRLQTCRAEPPELSCVSMKSNNSMHQPHNFSNERSSTDLRLQTCRAEPPELSCVSMKSNNSMHQPHNFSNARSSTDPRLQTSRAESPELSCVSMKSNNSMHQPHNFSNERSSTDPRLQTFRAESPELSCVSMKSNISMHQPHNFSNARSSTDPSYGRSVPFQDQSRCGVCGQIQTDPVSITCGHSFCRQCINSYWDQSAQSGDFACPRCKKRSKTRPVLYPHMEETIKPDYCPPVYDVLHRVSEKHKASMKNMYESLFEGFKTQETKILLNRIYTQLYIIEGETEGVNEEHEVLQMEKELWKHLQEIPINCLDIFKAVEGPLGEVEAENVRALMAEERKEELRTVLTKGIAGIGKTVSVHKFILDWAEGKANQDVDFMFVLPFRELNLIKDHQYSLHRLLCDFHPEFKDLHPKIYDQCKVVFIFDGLDESRIPLNFSDCEKVSDITMTSSVDVLMTNLIKGDLLPSALIWITSRPAAANQIPSQYINRVTEIQGFNDSQKEEYFRKRISDQEQATSIISHVRTIRSLHIMCHIPVFCWISATVLQRILKEGNTEIPKTLTEMYSHFLCTQTVMKSEKYGGEDQRDPKEVLESNRKMLLKLSALAFRQLMKGNVMFYEEDLRESGIDVTEASVYSGLCTEIFREECVLYQRKVYCFVHLSYQEFLAALHVFYCYVSKNMEELQFLKPKSTKWSDSVSLEELLRGAVRKAIKSETGHLDLFLRFLLGISLESSQQLLQDLLTQTVSSSESIKKTVEYIKRIIQSEDPPTDRSINLFLCLAEMKVQSLSKNIQSKKKLSIGQCLALAHMILISEEVLEELNLKNYKAHERGYWRLIPAVRNCRKAVLSGCKLTMNSWETLCSALKSVNSPLIELDLSNTELQDSGLKLICDGLKSSNCKLEILRLALCNIGEQSCENLGSALQSENSLKELDLSNNDLQDSGVELLSAGLRSSHCKLETLRLSGCLVTEKGCCSLASALSLNPSHLKDLDLTYNHPGESGENLLSARLKDPHCSLETLRLEHADAIMVKTGFKKYGCDLTLDPNTAHRYLSLSEGNRKVVCGEKQQSYPDHPERFDGWRQQVMSRESLTGRCYWEAEWSGSRAEVALTYKSISRKGRGLDCEFGRNEKSWTLNCSDNRYTVYHNYNRTALSTPPSGCRRVGVYVDCPAGTVSFYRVSSDTHTLTHSHTHTHSHTLTHLHTLTHSHTLTHLHTLSTTFTEPLYAGFCVYSDSSVCVCDIE